MKKFVSFMLVALLPMLANAYFWESYPAYDAKIDGVCYKFSGETAEVCYEWYIVSEDGESYESEYTGSVVIPESVTYKGKTYRVTSIGGCAFARSSDLISVTIPESVTSIGGSAFSDCNSLISITIPESVTSIDHWAFQGCRALTNIVIPNGVTVINQGVFSSCTSLKSVYIPEGVTSIGISAFSNCSSLASITIPNDVTSIGNGAFSGCRSLTSITIPEGITTIGSSTFSGCSGLKSVVIPNSVTSIGGGAFQNCSSLASVSIPAGVTNIGNEAFQGCSSLTDVYCYAVEPPSVKTRFEDEIWDGYPFNQYFIKEHTTLHVPASSLDSYKTALRWSDFGTIVGIPEEYYPEGTKWTEIRLDTLKYNSWYSKVGEDWVPNFETIEYYVQGEYTDMGEVYKKVYSNGPEWTDSLAFLLLESRQNVETTVMVDNYLLWPGVAYQFDWSVGKGIYYRDILESNSTGEYPIYLFFGVINEIKEGDFGGVRPLKYVDLDGKAPDNTYEYWDWGFTDARGGRIIQGIGITEWNDGECLFGPPDPYYAGYGWRGDYKSRHYRSMLVHFERNNEVLYDVWPKKPVITESVTFTAGQVATIILPVAPDASKGKYYRIDRVDDGQIIFEEEFNPQAHIPYIIVPNEDFCIDLNTLDLAGCYQDTVSVAGISFIGSYVSETFDYQEGAYIDIIDTTPDCRFDESCVIGALRAYLLVRWDDPYNQGGTRVPPMNKLEIVLHDYGTGIASPFWKTEEVSLFDLQGRKVAKPRKGIYIKDGRKVLIK